MHRWFRIWATFALVGLPLTAFSQESPANPGTIAQHKSKHKQTGSLLESLEDAISQQGKAIDGQGKLFEQFGKQIEQLSAQIAQESKQIEQQRTQIDALSEQLSRFASEAATRRQERAAATPNPPPPAEAAPSLPPAAETPPSMAATGTPSPAPATATDTLTHTVKKGENLISIAHHYGTTVAVLLKLNKIEDERKLQIGQILILPKPAIATPASQPPKE